MTYIPPLTDMRFVLEDLCRLDDITILPGFSDVSPELVWAILDEAGRFASEVLAPLNVIGDRIGAVHADGRVRLPDGWHDAYRNLVDMGWNSPAAAPDHGGMGLPSVVNACIQEMFHGANLAFQLCPMLTQGAIETIRAYASVGLQDTYLPHLVSGEWSGTMNLTEPQAGSDLAAIRCRAVPHGDHFLITGQKIFITYGDHDLTSNIIHLVLARLPDAPSGIKGISLFVVPKVLPGQDGSADRENDLRCVSIEQKLGIHASPTCTMSFGDNGGATGFLVGEPHKGVQYMFSMMNDARLNVGIQAIGLAEHATQKAISYASDRRQGRVPKECDSAIIGHPDVRRMLAQMKVHTEALRILACKAAASLDRSRHEPDAARRAYHQRRVDLLIPVVKGCATEQAITTASLGIQVHGGMGFIEETGAAQFLRDARITTIYEGTTGIQALDLLERKIVRDGGAAVNELLEEIKATASALNSMKGDAADWQGLSASVNLAANLLEDTTRTLLEQDDTVRLAGAGSLLELFGIALGAWAMGDAALCAGRRVSEGATHTFLLTKLRSAQLYLNCIFPSAASLAMIVEHGGHSILALQRNDFLPS